MCAVMVHRSEAPACTITPAIIREKHLKMRIALAVIMAEGRGSRAVFRLCCLQKP